jgi:hypothetical protein
MSTEASLKELGWGFIDEVYTMYKNGPEAYEIMKKNRKKNAEITQIKIGIKNNEDWYNTIKRQAYDNHISIDSCIQLNAEYVYSENHKNDPPSLPEKKLKKKLQVSPEKVKAFKMAIHKDKKWLKAIEQKSKEKHISLDSCINLDALWMAEQEAIDMQKKEFDAKVNDFKIAIKKDKKWLNDIAKKAKEKNISLDSCITLDAKWMAEQEMKDK